MPQMNPNMPTRDIIPHEYEASKIFERGVDPNRLARANAPKWMIQRAKQWQDEDIAEQVRGLKLAAMIDQLKRQEAETGELIQGGGLRREKSQQELEGLKGAVAKGAKELEMLQTQLDLIRSMGKAGQIGMKGGKLAIGEQKIPAAVQEQLKNLRSALGSAMNPDEQAKIRAEMDRLLTPYMGGGGGGGGLRGAVGADTSNKPISKEDYANLIKAYKTAMAQGDHDAAAVLSKALINPTEANVAEVLGKFNVERETPKSDEGESANWYVTEKQLKDAGGVKKGNKWYVPDDASSSGWSEVPGDHIKKEKSSAPTKEKPKPKNKSKGLRAIRKATQISSRKPNWQPHLQAMYESGAWKSRK